MGERGRGVVEHTTQLYIKAFMLGTPHKGGKKELEGETVEGEKGFACMRGDPGDSCSYQCKSVTTRKREFAYSRGRTEK